MVEREGDRFEEALAALRQNPQGMLSEDRRRLAAALADAILCGGAGGEPAIAAIVEILARDPDWTVRLEVARMVHLLDEEACSRYVAAFRTDCNTYVRSHAERSLARQRKDRRTSSRKRSACQGYAEQLDQLAKLHGKRLAAKVQSLADQRFSLLAAAVAHDVRSILTTLSANAAALADERGTAGRIQSIQEDIGFLKRTIEAMEQYTRPLPMQRQPEDIRQMIRQAIEKAREAVRQQGHDPAAVEVVVADAPAMQVRVTRRLIVFALTNIIQNAMESFADRDTDALRPGRIEVQVIVDGYETRIIISDDGPGIEPEVLKELASFVPIGPNKAKRSSSGWGLSLVHRYVTAHGGAVTVDSEMERGTTVVITLPMRDPEEGNDV
jgi:signal transduction histidine kinase